MVFREFGADRPETVLLLHGGGLSWWNYREAAALLQAGFHVILPVLDGHAGSDRPFTSVEDNALELLAFIDSRFGGSVLLAGGLSLGGQVLLEMLARRPGFCRFALAESAAVIPSPITAALAGPAFACSYGLIRGRHFSRLQFRSLHMKEDLFGDYYRDTCAIRREDMVSFVKASASYAFRPPAGGVKLHVFAGGKENRRILRSAEKLRREVPGCRVTVLPGLYHGEFSLNHPDLYARTVTEIIGGN